jgi:hypothetical protein
MQKGKEIQFKNLIDKYKHENFQKMKVITHEFLHSSVHPKFPDVFVCLEKNVYPNDLEFLDLEDEEEK